MGNTTGTGASAPVTPDTPQTIEGVTVSEPSEFGWCKVTFADGFGINVRADEARSMGLVVPEPTVPCRIGNAEFTLTREQVERVAALSGWSGAVAGAIGAAARAHLDSEGDR
jgi:hypothetical protein